MHDRVLHALGGRRRGWRRATRSTGRGRLRARTDRRRVTTRRVRGCIVVGCTFGIPRVGQGRESAGEVVRARRCCALRSRRPCPVHATRDTRRSSRTRRSRTESSRRLIRSGPRARTVGSGAEHPGQPTAPTLSSIGRVTKPISLATSSSQRNRQHPCRKVCAWASSRYPSSAASMPSRLLGRIPRRSLRFGRPRADDVRLTSRRTIARVVHIG